MVKEIHKINEYAENAIKHLAADFNYAEELHGHLQKIKTESKHAKAAIKEAHAMLRAYKYAAREGRKVTHDAGEIMELFDELGELLPREQKRKEETFARELKIASRMLKKLESFYQGKIKGEIVDVEKDERLLKRLERGSKDIEAIRLRNKLKEEFQKLDNDVNRLIKWIQTNTTLVENIRKWAQDLEKMAA